MSFRKRLDEMSLLLRASKDAKRDFEYLCLRDGLNDAFIGLFAFALISGQSLTEEEKAYVAQARELEEEYRRWN